MGRLGSWPSPPPPLPITGEGSTNSYLLVEYYFLHDEKRISVTSPLPRLGDRAPFGWWG